MKKITAYVSTLRVHWLVEELHADGVEEIMVTEFFKPTSQISRMEFYCDDALVDRVRETVHRVGTTGNVPDHDVVVRDFDPNLPSQIPLGKRVSRLEEWRIKRLIGTMFKGAARSISGGYLVITLSILLVGVFVYMQTGTLREDYRQTSRNTRAVQEAVHHIQRALLGEMLAAERLHRGEAAVALQDMQTARSELKEALDNLKNADEGKSPILDSVAALELKFQTTVHGMFSVVRNLAGADFPVYSGAPSGLLTTHDELMNALDVYRRRLLQMLSTLDEKVNADRDRVSARVDSAVAGVQISLTLLTVAAVVIAVLTWIMTERKVARPIHVLVEEANAIDPGWTK